MDGMLEDSAVGNTVFRTNVGCIVGTGDGRNVGDIEIWGIRIQDVLIIEYKEGSLDGVVEFWIVETVDG